MPSTLHANHHSLFFFQKSLSHLFWACFFRYCALAITSIFSVLFLYQLGPQLPLFSQFSLSVVQQGLLTVAGFFLIMRATAFVFLFPVARLSQKIGLVWGIVLGNIFTLLKLLCFILFPYSNLFLILAAVVMGLEVILYYPNYQTLFALKADMDKMGRDVGAFDFILKLVYGMLPVLAGTIVIVLGYANLFWIGVLFLLVANIPLLFVNVKLPRSKPTFQGALHWMKRPLFRKITFALFFQYAYDAANTFWPIYVLLLVGGVDRVGFLVSMGFFLSLIVTYFSGWMFDHKKSKTPIIFGVLILASSWVLKLLTRTPSMIVGAEVVDKLGGSLLFPWMDATFYQIAKEHNPHEFYIYREFHLTIIAMMFWVLALVLIAVLPL